MWPWRYPRFSSEVDYLGIDYSEDYIDAARHRFGGRGRFLVADVGSLGSHRLDDFDVVLALGILHHLDDDPPRALFATCEGI